MGSTFPMTDSGPERKEEERGRRRRGFSRRVKGKERRERVGRGTGLVREVRRDRSRLGGRDVWNVREVSGRREKEREGRGRERRAPIELTVTSLEKEEALTLAVGEARKGACEEPRELEAVRKVR